MTCNNAVKELAFSKHVPPNRPRSNQKLKLKDFVSKCQVEFMLMSFVSDNSGRIRSVPKPIESSQGNKG